jgi:hypothetical protein
MGNKKEPENVLKLIAEAAARLAKKPKSAPTVGKRIRLLGGKKKGN